MPYSDRFIHADELISHLDEFLDGVPDEYIKSKYVGFLSVAAVTVYELAIKDILTQFAQKKHSVFGSFLCGQCSRMNGHIRRDDLEKDYISRFGEKYNKRFKKNLDVAEKIYLVQNGKSIKNCYANIITWRHQFAHEGVIPPTATYEETKIAYEFGKHVLHCLAKSLER